jgi:hypothetical protein
MMAAALFLPVWRLQGLEEVVLVSGLVVVGMLGVHVDPVAAPAAAPARAA